MKGARIFDTVACYDGEKFVVVMPETDIILAMTAIERLRHGFGDGPFTAITTGQKLELTIRIGVTEVDVTVDDTTTSLNHRADEALNAAKSAVKNRVQY